MRTSRILEEYRDLFVKASIPEYCMLVHMGMTGASDMPEDLQARTVAYLRHRRDIWDWEHACGFDATVWSMMGQVIADWESKHS